MTFVEQGISKVIFDQATIQNRVEELGKQITADFSGRSLYIIGVLTGSVPFVADLIRCIHIPLELDFVAATSYGNGIHSSGEVRLIKDIGHPIEGKNVLVVEDIIDTGQTLRSLLDMLRSRKCSNLDVAVLLDKPARRIANVDVKYCGFAIEDHFVVGYGLDYAGLYRNLPYIAELKI